MEGAYRMGGADSRGLMEIEREYGERLCRAFASGRGVVEMARLIGCRKAVSVYRVLQRRGVIDSSLKRSRYRGPPELESALRKTGMSFAQWCNCWRFEPKSAQEELLKADASTRPDIRQAVRRDFPRLCGEETGAVDLDEWEIEVSSLTTVPSFRIDWDHKLERFVGRIAGVESLLISGRYPSVVMAELVRAAWLLGAIEVLVGVGERSLNSRI